jgi:flagella synthesis protein FlgN
MKAVEQSLLNCLKEETIVVGEFKTALEIETRALTDRGALHELEAVSETKNRLINRLAELDAQRDTLFKRLGLPAGWEEATQAMNDKPELAQAWSQLQQISRVAQELNKRNGVLLEVHLRHTQRSLDALNAVINIDKTYDHQGRVRPIASGKPLGAC